MKSPLTSIMTIVAISFHLCHPLSFEDGLILLAAAKTTSNTSRLRRALRGREYFTLAFGTMVGVRWMVVIEDCLTRGRAFGAMPGFLIGGLVLIPHRLRFTAA